MEGAAPNLLLVRPHAAQTVLSSNMASHPLHINLPCILILFTLHFSHTGLQKLYALYFSNMQHFK